MSTVATGSLTTSAASASDNGNLTLQGSSWNFSEGTYDELTSIDLYHQWGITLVDENQESDGSDSSESGSWTTGNNGLIADNTYKTRAKGVFHWRQFSPPATWTNKTTTKTGTTKNKKTGAVVASASTPAGSNATSSTADISCNYYPNVNASTCSAQLQYKKSSDSEWTNGGTAATYGGYSQHAATASLTGLDASTQYQVRLVITRTTSTDTSLTSSTGTFTTLAADPTVTTNAATGIGYQSAQLNATVDVGNRANDCDLKWVYSTSNPPEGGTTVACASNPLSASGSFSKSISGLADSTTYYARATVYWPTGTTTNSDAGDVVSFSTTSDPGEDARDEDHMITQYVDCLYGSAATAYFQLRSLAADSSDVFYSGDAPSASLDINIWKDGVDDDIGGGSTITKVAGTLSGATLYKIVTAAADAQADVLDVVLHSADTGARAFRDHHIQFRTKQSLSQVVVNAANRTNTSAVTYTGVGTGHGLSCVGGATGKDIDGYMGGPAGVLYWGDDASGDSSTQVTITTGTGPYNYSATADAYNGHLLVVLSGTGAGQSRPIVDYDGAGVVTVSPAYAVAPSGTVEVAIIPGPQSFGVSPGAELSATPAATSSYGAMLQFLFQRFAYRRKQDANYQYLYKADSATLLAKGTFEDNTTDQDLGKVADA